MQRRWQDNMHRSPLIYGRSVPPAVYDPEWLWWNDQQLTRAILCFDKDAMITIENIPSRP